MRGASISTTSSRALLAACDRLGLDTERLLATVGVARDTLLDPDARIPGEQVAALFRSALATSGDPDLALRAAEAVPFGAYRAIDFLAASAPTVGEGITRVARYFPLINSTAQWTIRDELPHVRVELSNPRDPSGIPQPYAEYALAVTVLHCRRAAGVDWPLVTVELPFEEPDSRAVHERVFGCPVRFGAPRAELVLDHATWRLPTRAPSSDLLRVLEEHAAQQVAALTQRDAVQGKVLRCVSEELRGGEPTLANVAKRLAMSPRTLQRKLAEEGSSFADVLDKTRKTAAQGYLTQASLALTEIAYLLGFSEQSAFTRAFMRWYGVAPSRYRMQAKTGATAQSA